jgi:hypothetical protein
MRAQARDLKLPGSAKDHGPGFTLGPGEYFPNVSTNELQSPAFTRAAKACGVQLPSLPPCRAACAWRSHRGRPIRTPRGLRLASVVANIDGDALPAQTTRDRVGQKLMILDE